MTNRDYLRSLSNEELAELMARKEICDCLIETCLDCVCSKCIKKWLDTKRKTHVEKGQIREANSIK